METRAHRPTFEILTERGAEALADRVCAMTNDDPHLDHHRTGTHVQIMIAKPERHFWSPWLTVEYEAVERGTRIHGRFSPHPNVWTCFALTYLALGTILFFAIMWAGAQAMLDRAPTALWVTPACLLIAGIMFWSSQIGQKLARTQMDRLREVLEKSVREEESTGD